tara:strand:+ start:1648 stop:2502 length:855 start_codon:yes stop_codon:yes gene_type:complete
MPVNIHGKEYRTVAERIVLLHEKLEGDCSVTTEIVSIDDDKVIMKSTITHGELIWTGHALEVFGSSMINKTSALENAETSSLGRALAFAGLGGEEIASADEVANAIAQQNNSYASNGVSKTTETPVVKTGEDEPLDWTDEKRASNIPFGKHKGTPWSEVPNGYITWLVNNSDNENWKLMATAEIIARSGSKGANEEKDDNGGHAPNKKDVKVEMLTKLINEFGKDKFQSFSKPLIGDRKTHELSEQEITKLADDFRDSVAEKTTPVDKSVAMFNDGGDDDDLPF